MANKSGFTKIKRSINWQDIIMNNKQQFNSDKISLEFLKAKLRSIENPKVPVSLKQKLLDSIPHKTNKNFSVHSLPKRLTVLKFSASAAIIGILVLVIVLNSGPSINSSGSYDEINNYPNDLNDPVIEDINLATYYKMNWNIKKNGVIKLK